MERYCELMEQTPLNADAHNDYDARACYELLSRNMWQQSSAVIQMVPPGYRIQ